MLNKFNERRVKILTHRDGALMINPFLLAADMVGYFKILVYLVLLVVPFTLESIVWEFYLVVALVFWLLWEYVHRMLYQKFLTLKEGDQGLYLREKSTIGWSDTLLMTRKEMESLMIARAKISSPYFSVVRFGVYLIDRLGQRTLIVPAGDFDSLEKASSVAQEISTFLGLPVVEGEVSGLKDRNLEGKEPTFHKAKVEVLEGAMEGAESYSDGIKANMAELLPKPVSRGKRIFQLFISLPFALIFFYLQAPEFCNDVINYLGKLVRP